MTPDWPGAAVEATDILRALLRIRTVNPPGDERQLAEYLAGVLAANRIETETVETAPGRAALRAIIRGAGVAPPLILLAHTDVVGADPAEWSVDPFGGVVRDGRIYGRGAIDDKGMLAVLTVTLILLRRLLGDTAAVLARDVVLLALPDEESGGGAGIEWIAANRRSWLDGEFALNEGGRVRVEPGGTRTLLLQHAEKTPHTVTLTAHGTAAHAGTPRADNPIVALGRAIAAIADHVTDPEQGISPTVLSAGNRTNVIPATAQATLDVRTRPGESVDEVVERIRHMVRDVSVAVEIGRRGDPSPHSPWDTPFVHAVVEAARVIDPHMSVQPYLSAGATDSAQLRRLGVATYGLLPFPLEPTLEERMHGADECLPLDSLAFGLRLVYEIVLRVAGAETVRRSRI